MGKTEIAIFLCLGTLILLVFIGGIIVFVFQYHKRKLLYENEKAVIKEQHIQELLNTKLEIQKHTMQDIGREIHDNVGQRLTLASLYANQLVYEDQFPQISERVSSVAKIINESLDELRSLSKSLTNPNAEIAELRELIENECGRVNELKICIASCSFNKDGFRISTTVKSFILRIIQEFIQNSLKHARCRQISLDFDFDGGRGLSIAAADDGEGFDTDLHCQATDKGIGLVNMRKRAELIGADFSIYSAVGKGTTMNIFIPVDKLNSH